MNVQTISTQLPAQSSVITQEPSLLKGVKVLLEGPGGTGKTFAIGTLVETGVDVFYFGLENGMEALMGYFTDKPPRGKGLSEPPSNLHWHNMQLQVPGGFKTMGTMAQQIGMMTYDALCKLQDMNRASNNQFEKLLSVLNNFTDQRTGKEYGAVDTWGPDRCLVIDGMTGLSKFAMSMVIGARPTAAPSDYLVAQRPLESLIRYICDGCKCHFVLLSHVEREIDPVVGGTKITTATIGKALAPIIPPMFSDVVLATRNGAKWSWDTLNPLADLKTRSLPLSQDVVPHFQGIIEIWKSRGGKFSPTVKV